MDQVAWRPDQEVWLLTFDTWDLVVPIVRTLKERKVAFRLRRTRDPLVFPYASGIMGVPLTLVLDPQGLVQALASGKLRDDSLRVIASYLNGEKLSKARRPFFAVEGVNDVRDLGLSRMR
ncbi:MAG TPA: hypothetical protein VNJ11_00105 [Bryobacteraceae bacterium]|nr:hypothetical protein [Bryobacteraceae bacterium]